MIAITGIGLLMALAATIDPLAPSVGEPGARLMVRLPDRVRIVAFALFALSAMIFLALQRPRRRNAQAPFSPHREPRRLSPWAAALLSLPVLVSLTAVAYLVWYRWSTGGGQPIGAGFAAISQLLELLSSSRKPTASAPLFNAALAALVLMAAVATLALMLLITFAERLHTWWAGQIFDDAAPQLHGAIVDSLDDLRAEPDARAAIVRVYRRFEHALSTARTPRAPWQTPSEFMGAALARLPVPRPPVERLTALFEIARFSNRQMGTEARDSACDCLDEINIALDDIAPALGRETRHAL